MIVYALFKHLSRLTKALRVFGKYNSVSTGALVLATALSIDRPVMIAVRVTQAFADAGGTQPTFKIGQTATTNKFADTAVFANAAKGDLFHFAGTLSSTRQLLVTAVPAVGAGTGAISVEAVIVPATA